jgi:pimeloyl-ACP methyl ester carboxylesterase
MDAMVTSAKKVGINSVVCMETDGWLGDMIYAARESYFLENLEGDARVDNVIARLPRQGEASLSGYSYGAVVAARAAVKYLEDNPAAKLDSLVLIGSPVVRDGELDAALHALRKQGRIDKLIAADIASDPFSSPYMFLLPVVDFAKQLVTMQGDAPHFSFAHDTKKSDLLRAKLWGSVAAAIADMEEAKKGRAKGDESGLFRRVVIHPEIWKEESHDLDL